MADILIRGYKAKEQIEDIIKEARYAANNCMIGSGLEIIELPEHGDLIDRSKLSFVCGGTTPMEMDYVRRYIVDGMPVVIPSIKEETE